MFGGSGPPVAFRMRLTRRAAIEESVHLLQHELATEREVNGKDLLVRVLQTVDAVMGCPGRRFGTVR